MLRGAAVLVQSMALGIKALNYSAAEAFEAEETEEVKVAALTPAVVEGEGDFAGITGGVPGLFPVPTRKRPEDELKRGSAAAFGSIAFALVFNVLLFVVAPLVLTNALFIGMGWADGRTQAPEASTQQTADAAPQQQAAAGGAQVAAAPWYTRAYEGARGYLKPVKPNVAFNLIDGGIRMFIFILMISSFSLSKDIRRVFEYHGAEHKTVFNWEAGLAALGRERAHPAAPAPALRDELPDGRDARLHRALLGRRVQTRSPTTSLVRIALMPIVAGLTYEIIRLSAKKEGCARLQADDAPRRLAPEHHDQGARRPAARSRHRRAQRVAQA